MRLKTRLPLVAVLFLLALPLIFTGNASAMYMDDGAVQHATNGGWQLPTDMVCIKGVHTDGTIDLVAGVTNSRDCIYYNTGLTGMNPVDVTATSTCGTAGTLTCNSATNCTGTAVASHGTLTWNATDLKCYDSAPCTVAGAAGNDGAKHALATSICVNGSGAGLSLKNLDRTAQMCVAKGGTWKQTSATAPSGMSGTFPTPGFGGACVAYGRQFAGQNATTGVPLAFGAKGTTQAAGTGYCYTTMNMTTAYSTSATCPSVAAAQAPFNANAAYDWAFSSSKCSYAKGIKGYPSSALTKVDGTTNPTNVNIDLSTFTTMGDCLAQGGSWNNWTGQAASTTAVATTPVGSTIPAWNYTTQAPDADTGCLHCHSTTVEYNGPAEREKDSYLKTGHKNMLRTVTAGKPWAGPDGVAYTTDGTVTIDFSTATVTGGKKLFYIYGDWMIASPTLVYETVAGNNTSAYTCGSCHTAGYSDASKICTVNPAVNTTAGACTAAGGTMTAIAAPGVESIGTPGYAGVQPQASFPSLSLGTLNPKWDLNGIQCARCHNAGVGPVNATMIAASPYTTTQPTGGGMGALTATNTGRTDLCFGCHQSEAKIWPAGTTTTLDPTVIPTGASHGAAYGRDFNGHVIGQSFLNSVHGQFTGTVQLNSIGKYDLFGLNGAGGTYASIFKGFACWQSPSSTSPAKTLDATGAEITNKAACESLYGAGSWRADNGGSTSDPTYKQGTCATCHDVHNSLFVASQEEAAIRKTCQACHVDNATTFATDPGAPQVVVAGIQHPTGAGTPFDTTMYSNACVVCHMATQAVANGDQNTIPAHVWRINTSAAYNTFPTSAQFYGGSCSVGTPGDFTTPPQYTTSAACTTAVPTPGVWTPTTQNRNATMSSDNGFANAVWVDLDLACGQCHGGTLGASKVQNGAPYYSKVDLAPLAAVMHLDCSIPANANQPGCYPTSHNNPTAACTLTPGSGTVNVTSFALTGANTADPINGTAPKVFVNWGDGSAMAQGTLVGPFNKTYSTTGTFTITKVVKDALGYSASCTATATVSIPTVAASTGTLAISPAGTWAPASAASISYYVKLGGITKASGTVALGATKNIALGAGAYTVYLYFPGGHTCTVAGDIDAVTGMATVPAAVTVGNTTTVAPATCN